MSSYLGAMFSTKQKRLVRATVTAMGATALCMLAVHLSGLDLAVRGRDASVPTQVPLGAVLLATAAGGVAAYLLVRLAARSARPRRTFAVAVTAGLALSCVPPVQAASTTSTVLAMHVIVAAVIVPPAARLLQPLQSIEQSPSTGTSR